MNVERWRNRGVLRSWAPATATAHEQASVELGWTLKSGNKVMHCRVLTLHMYAHQLKTCIRDKS